MAANKNDYVLLLHELLPPGLAFPRDDFTSPLAIVLDAIAEECAALDATCDQLIVESDPRTAVQSFDEWLEEFAVPNECVVAFTEGEIPAEDLRRELVIKASHIGGQSAGFYVELARLLGRKIRIKENYDDPRYPFSWFFVNVLGEFSQRFSTVMMTVKDPLSVFGDAMLECLIKRYKPAHTGVTFVYLDYERFTVADNVSRPLAWNFE